MKVGGILYIIWGSHLIVSSREISYVPHRRKNSANSTGENRCVQCAVVRSIVGTVFSLMMIIIVGGIQKLKTIKKGGLQ